MQTLFILPLFQSIHNAAVFLYKRKSRLLTDAFFESLTSSALSHEGFRLELKTRGNPFDAEFFFNSGQTTTKQYQF